MKSSLYYFIISFFLLLRADPIDVSTSPPGGLDPEEVPQLILITFDDSTTSAMYENIQRINGHTNPDGSPIAFTFYVSLDSPDFYNSHRLHAEGHEIAIHTVSHTTGNTTSLEDWAREIAHCVEGLVRYGGIPREDLRGFRFPFLAYNQHGFHILHEMGFAYETSVPEPVPGLITQTADAMIWPYHLHEGLQQHAWTGTPPDQPLPGLMEVPMWQLQRVGGGQHNMDPEEPSKEAMVEMLKHNFTTRYEGNRVPVAIWNHAGWIDNDDHVDALNEFLAWALAHDDVWVVPVIKLVDWMNNPLPVSNPAHAQILTVDTYEAVPEEDAITNVLGTAYVRSVQRPLPAVPSPSSLFLELTPQITDVTFRVEIVSDWGTGFQANLVADNPTPETFAFWSGTLDPGEATLPEPWNLSLEENEDGSLTFQSMGAPAVPIEANSSSQVLATFWATGSSADVWASGSILTPVAPLPALSLKPEGTLSWNSTAPMYEVQKKTDLDTETWETIELLYGTTAVTLPEETGTVFYRIRPIH